MADWTKPVTDLTGAMDELDATDIPDEDLLEVLNELERALKNLRLRKSAIFARVLSLAETRQMVWERPPLEAVK